MKTRVAKTPLDGLLVIDVDFFRDERGFFVESWHKQHFAEEGLPHEFVQDSHSQSGYRGLRGLHYQDMRAPMAKLERCTAGRAFDVAVDRCLRSATFGKGLGVEHAAEDEM